MSFFKKLVTGLKKSTEKITSGITDVFTKEKLDQEMIDAFEELLIMVDLGPQTAQKISQNLAAKRFGEEVDKEEIKAFLKDQIVEILEPVAKDFELGNDLPEVVLMVGINGTGKTTTIGKLASKFKQEGKKVLVVAGDTFRAAAIEQVEIWCARADVDLLKTTQGKDPSGLVFDALKKAQAENYDVVLIDTAGRLQNKEHLMAELEKLVRVMKKVMPEAPHHTILTLDATTGQNAFSQVKIFQESVHINGLVLTKLDGSSKGGVLIGLADQYQLPVYAIGVGESLNDLNAFEPEAFATSLVGLGEKTYVDQ